MLHLSCFRDVQVSCGCMNRIKGSVHGDLIGVISCGRKHEARMLNYVCSSRPQCSQCLRYRCFRFSNHAAQDLGALSVHLPVQLAARPASTIAYDSPIVQSTFLHFNTAHRYNSLTINSLFYCSSRGSEYVPCLRFVPVPTYIMQDHFQVTTLNAVRNRNVSIRLRVSDH